MDWIRAPRTYSELSAHRKSSSGQVCFRAAKPWRNATGWSGAQALSSKPPAASARILIIRFSGSIGSRPAAAKDLGFASAYVFGAVCPVEGKAAALIMPVCNTAAMNHHLSEISSQVAADAHAVVILDRAGWHRSQTLVVPGNITLLELPPYSPELNPVERIWHYLRSHWLANTVFLRDGLEPVRHQPRPDPLALRGPLDSSFARSLGDPCYPALPPPINGTLVSGNLRRSVLDAQFVDRVSRW